MHHWLGCSKDLGIAMLPHMAPVRKDCHYGTLVCDTFWAKLARPVYNTASPTFGNEDGCSTWLRVLPLGPILHQTTWTPFGHSARQHLEK